MFGLFRKNNVDSININELDDLVGKINLIDVREPYEYKYGHIPTSKNIPMNKILLESDKHLDKSKEYHIICHSGARSSRVCSRLKAKGFKIINVTGGIGRYRGKLEK